MDQQRLTRRTSKGLPEAQECQLGQGLYRSKPASNTISRTPTRTPREPLSPAFYWEPSPGVVIASRLASKMSINITLS